LAQLVAPFLFALGAMTSIMLLNQVARRFGRLVGKGLPWSVILEVFALSIPFIVAMTLPMAILLAVLYTFTHLAADNEITAMRASGVSVAQLLAPVVIGGALLAAANFALVDQFLPRSNAKLRTLLIDISRKKPTLDLREQAINEIPPSRLFLRASRIDPASGRLREVTIYDMGARDGRRVIYADSGHMAFAENQADLLLRLHNGEIHEFKNVDPHDFQLTAFQTNNILVRNVANELERGTVDAVRGDREMSTCEMRTVVNDSERERQLALGERGRSLHQDLRTLLGLPPPPPPPEVPPPEAPCGWWRSVLRLLLPETAQAQDTAQRRDSLRKVRARILQQKATRSRSDRIEVAPPQELPPGVGLEGQRVSFRPRRLPLASWSEISMSRDVARVAGRKVNRYQVEIHKKWAISLACLIFVLVGVPLALRFPRGGMGLVIGGGLVVFAIYYMGLTAGESLGDIGLVSPLVAMWAPNFLLLTLGILGLLWARRASGSTRGGDLTEVWQAVRGVRYGRPCGACGVGGGRWAHRDPEPSDARRVRGALVAQDLCPDGHRVPGRRHSHKPHG
jgi:lipopolysaccharide export system permease protein